LQVLICGLFFGIPIDETGNKGYSNCNPDLENATEEEGDERYPYTYTAIIMQYCLFTALM